MFLAGVTVARGQNLLPNPGFETGAGDQPDRPADWRLQGSGAWATNAASGRRALMIEGNGSDSGVWQTDSPTLKPGGLYRLTFLARKDPGTSGGCVVSGPGRVNRDFQPGETWDRYGFVFSVPENGSHDVIRLGQWQVKGRLYFDDVELLPVRVVHDDPVFDSTRFGDGESLERGVYRFRPNYGGPAANFHQPLWRNRAAFNSDRWVFSPTAEVIYCFTIPGTRQTNARVRLNVNYHLSGSLRVEAARDATNWFTVTTLDGQRRSGAFELPASVFPARQVFLRLSMPEGEGNLQVNACDYEAGLEAPLPERVGESHFLQVVRDSPDVSVEILFLKTRGTRGQVLLGAFVRNTSSIRQVLSAFAEPGPVQPNSGPINRLLVLPGNQTLFTPIVKVREPGRHQLTWGFTNESGQTLFAVRTDLRYPLLGDPRPGYRILGAENAPVWWCESGWKVGPAMGPEKDAPAKAVSVGCARGEFEPVQIMIGRRADARARQLLGATTTSFRNRQGEVAPISVEVAEVAYVDVVMPTDSSCQRGLYPDPLPPLKLPLSLRGNESNPLWLTFRVRRETRAGDYAGELRLQVDAEEIRVPLAVHVYDFEMPKETHLRSALGLGTPEINRYHRLTNREQQELVFGKYLRNFAEHRISPYSFFDYAPIDVRFSGEGTNRQAKVDFTKFDVAAAQWLDEAKFNSFLLPLRGMGGGTFHSRHLGELEGFKEGTPEFARLFQDYLGQVEAHLREKGWLDKAYTYWFDEPDPKDYAFVVDGMKRIQAAAPGLKRMLTEQPEPELTGHVEIWCGLTPEWTPAKVKARRDAGEEVWWYICTGPKAPYVTEFIDHPGTELRLWPWQSWQYGVSGILIWATIYWTSSCAYPAPALQNPWEDPMSWVSGYDTPVGTRQPWGNGDGRFLYPPRRDPNTATEACLDEPINSIRWENLRDGMEDYEYFWLLDREVRRLEARKTMSAGERNLLREAEGLLVVPDAVSKDLTHFTTDPRPMLEHRDRVARMIERLQRFR